VARKHSLTTVVTHSGAISRAEMTSTMVLRSQVRGDRSSAAIPEVESRPEMEEHLAEVEITVPITDDNLGIARPGTAEKTSFTTFYD